VVREKVLEPAHPWIQVTATKADWEKADPALLTTMFGQLHLIRAFEEMVLELAGEGLVHGPAHSSVGQEGGPSAPSWGSAPRMLSMALTEVTTNSSPKRWVMWPQTDLTSITSSRARLKGS